MKLVKLPLLAYENIDPEVIQRLREEGFDIAGVIGNGCAGKDDEEVLGLAHSQGRAVLTHDSDFGTLVIAAGKPFTGIIYLKPGHIQTAFTLQSLSALLEKIEDVSPPFIIVVQHNSTGIRIRYRPFGNPLFK
jgi:predicted nuclease of predicted toxin-antitoxin system